MYRISSLREERNESLSFNKVAIFPNGRAPPFQTPNQVTIFRLVDIQHLDERELQIQRPNRGYWFVLTFRFA